MFEIILPVALVIGIFAFSAWLTSRSIFFEMIRDMRVTDADLVRGFYRSPEGSFAQFKAYANDARLQASEQLPSIHIDDSYEFDSRTLKPGQMVRVEVPKGREPEFDGSVYIEPPQDYHGALGSKRTITDIDDPSYRDARAYIERFHKMGGSSLNHWIEGSR